MNWLFILAVSLVVLGWAGLAYALSSWIRLRHRTARADALAAGIRNDPTDLEAIMDAVRDAEPLEIDGPVVRAYADRYAGRDLVPYGRSQVHTGCMLARADAASDHICALCAVEFVRSVIA